MLNVHWLKTIKITKKTKQIQRLLDVISLIRVKIPGENVYCGIINGINSAERNLIHITVNTP